MLIARFLSQGGSNFASLTERWIVDGIWPAAGPCKAPSKTSLRDVWCPEEKGSEDLHVVSERSLRKTILLLAVGSGSAASTLCRSRGQRHDSRASATSRIDCQEDEVRCEGS
jgi:hypothetical protein